MKIEDIKVGETYMIPITVKRKDEISITSFICERASGYPISCDYFDIFPLLTRPKYDPHRKFRKGDIARPRTVDGRKEYHFKDGDVLKVCRDEDKYSRVSVENQEGVGIGTMACFLELVTPVEELEPYSVETCQYGYTVNKGELILATYNDETHPHAHKAAEAECKRLNAKYRNDRQTIKRTT